MVEEDEGPRTTRARKKFDGLKPIFGNARRRRIRGAIPKKNVGPGCVFQQEGRSHHTSVERIRAVIAT
jgi:hypothetical protein